MKKTTQQKPWSKPVIKRDFSKLNKGDLPLLRKAVGELPRVVGECYVFMRECHEWHACEVAVLSIKGALFTVARATDVCEGLLAKPGSKKRKLNTWTCTRAELW